MLKKPHGLFYKNGKWHVRNYRREIKGGMYRWTARFVAWSRNRRGETPIIDLKRIVPQPWAKGEYGPEIALKHPTAPLADSGVYPHPTNGLKTRQ